MRPFASSATLQSDGFSGQRRQIAQAWPETAHGTSVLLLHVHTRVTDPPTLTAARA